VGGLAKGLAVVALHGGGLQAGMRRRPVAYARD
jgi:hypothetical protein